MSASDWNDGEQLGDQLGDDLSGQIKAELDPSEYLLWADRPSMPAGIKIPFVPAVFVSVLAGLSGFSLAAMFGLVGQAWLDRWTVVLAFGLAPLILGGMIVAQLISLLVRRFLRRRWLARWVYALTDHRAIVARIDVQSGLMESFSLRPGDVADTRCFENPDGSGDLFFLGQDGDSWLPFGFFEVPRVGLVETLARETLLGTEGDWWKYGPAHAL